MRIAPLSDETLIGIDQLILGTAAACDLKDLYGSVTIPTGTRITPKLIRHLKDSRVVGLVADRPDFASHHFTSIRPALEVISARIAEMHKRSGLGLPLTSDTYNRTAGTLSASFSAICRGKNPPIDALYSVSELILHDIKVHETPPVPVGNMKIGSLVDRYVANAIDVAILLGWHAGKSGMSGDDLLGAILGGLLHDAGMLLVPKEILELGSSLSQAQKREIHRHPYLGMRALSPMRGKIPKSASDIILLHHEREDGKGYPLRRSGDAIPVVARMAHIVDSYIALVSRRFHRRGYLPHQAIELLMRESGRSYNRNCLKEFVSRIGRYPKGSAVLLSSNEVGIVVGQGKGGPMKPIVDVYFSRQQQFSHTPQRVDLGSDIKRFVQYVVT